MTTTMVSSPPARARGSSVEELLLDLEVAALRAWAWRGFDAVVGIDAPWAHRAADYWLGVLEEIDEALTPDVRIWWERPARRQEAA